MNDPANLPIEREERSRNRDRDDRDDRDRPRRPRARPLPPARSKGVLPRAKVRFACFLVLVLSLLLAGVLMILAVWEAAPSEVAWKAVATVAIIAGLMAGFTVLNEAFGSTEEPAEEPHPKPDGEPT
jgi:hypothetical protein